MVRRGSTVRVRQRALQKPRKAGLGLSGSLARSTACGSYGALYGAFRSRSVSAKRKKRAIAIAPGPRPPPLGPAFMPKVAGSSPVAPLLKLPGTALFRGAPAGFSSKRATGHERSYAGSSAAPPRLGPCPKSVRHSRRPSRRPTPYTWARRSMRCWRRATLRICMPGQTRATT
jgi:hypothetical protein